MFRLQLRINETMGYFMKKEKYYVFFKYLGVGVINTLVGLTSILLLFNIIHLNYWAATFLGNLIGIIVSFFLNKRYTFKYKGKNRSSLVKFLLVSLISYIISYTLGYYMDSFIKESIPHVGIAENTVIIFSSGIYTVIGFFGHKKVTFGSKPLGEL
jgi:putative flippase GtrA